MSAIHPIKSDITAGSVYYYNDPRLRATYSHYCIVVNIDPAKDTDIILVHASHKIDKVKKRRKNCPDETLVEITPIQYAGFDKESVIDCNDVFVRDVELLANKLGQGKLVKMPIMGLRLVRKLREGIIASNQVSQHIKDLLKE
ncbi:MAG: hypothetical protein ABSF21_04440 [Dehalococcoidia bacterium]